MSILLNPLVNWLQRYKVPRILAITIALLLEVIIVSGLVYFLSAQVAQFRDSLPMLKERFAEITTHVRQYLSTELGIGKVQQDKAVQDALNGGKALAGQTLFGIFGVLTIVILLPVYMFFLLFYKALILNFLYEVFTEENAQRVADVLVETKSAIQSFLNTLNRPTRSPGSHWKLSRWRTLLPLSPDVLSPAHPTTASLKDISFLTHFGAHETKAFPNSAPVMRCPVALTYPEKLSV